MEFFQVVKRRHSIRAFLRKDVEEEKVQRLLEAANAAPSAGNLQAYEIYLVKDPSVKEALARAAYGQGFVASAPILLVFFANPGRSEPRYGQRGRRLYCIQDASIATTFAMLAATDLGLATTWVGAFDDASVSRAVRAPSHYIPISILPVGYPGEEPYVTPRRDLSDLVHTA